MVFTFDNDVTTAYNETGNIAFMDFIKITLFLHAAYLQEMYTLDYILNVLWRLDHVF